MARWYRSGRYYGRNRGYYGRRRYYKSGSKKAFGQMKAAKQQADQSTFTVNVPSQLTAFLHDATINETSQVTGVYPLNIFELLRKSDFFNNYANMYDEFKIEKVKVKLLPTQWAMNNSTGNYFYKNITVYTAWDRSGLDSSQLVFDLSSPQQITKVENNDYLIGNASGGGVYCCVGENITSYSSAESRVVNPNSNTTIVRWLSPKTMQERSQWLSTGTLKKWYNSFDETTGRFYGIPCSYKVGSNTGETVANFEQIFDLGTNDNTVTLAGGVLELFNSTLSSENPCSPFEDVGVKFKPTLLVGVYPKDNNTVQVGNETVPTNSIKFNVETEVVCSFRGLRKSKVVAA